MRLKKNNMMSKGQITYQVILLVASPILAIAGSYWGNLSATEAKIHDVSTVINKEISEDRQRISSLETDNKQMKEWLNRIEAKLDKAIQYNLK